MQMLKETSNHYSFYCKLYRNERIPQQSPSGLFELRFSSAWKYIVAHNISDKDDITVVNALHGYTSYTCVHMDIQDTGCWIYHPRSDMSFLKKQQDDNNNSSTYTIYACSKCFTFYYHHCLSLQMKVNRYNERAVENLLIDPYIISFIKHFVALYL